jgi:hypothetical protein
MTLTLTEGLIDTIAAYFSGANFTTKLAALDAEYPDAITLTVPVATYVGIKSLRSMQDYPALFIYSDEQEFEPLSATGGKDWPAVFIGISEVDMDAETLQRRVYRYRRAIIEMLLAMPSIATGWVIATGEKWQSGTFVDDRTESNESDSIGTAVVRIRASSAWQEM